MEGPVIKPGGQSLDNAQRRNETNSLTQELFHATQTLSRRELLKRAAAAAAVSLPALYLLGLWPQRPQQPGEPGSHRHGQPRDENCRGRFFPWPTCGWWPRPIAARATAKRLPGWRTTTIGQRLHAVSRLPRRAGPQGRGRRDHQHGRPLARAAGRICGPGRQGHVRREALGRGHGLGLEAARRGGPPQGRLPVRHDAAAATNGSSAAPANWCATDISARFSASTLGRRTCRATSQRPRSRPMARPG